MIKKECFKCKEMINLDKDLYVNLGTHDGKKDIRIDYFHFDCWRKYFEECSRKKAKAVVKGYSDKMMPFAKQMTERLKNEIERRS